MTTSVRADPGVCTSRGREGAAGFGAGAAGSSLAAILDLGGAGVSGSRLASAASPSATTATTALTSTVAPSGALISASTPATGEGISASTLSVEISKRGSSFCTTSPVFLSHLVMVPSKIDSPIWGMTTSIGMDGILRDPKGPTSARFLPDYKSQGAKGSGPR